MSDVFDSEVSLATGSPLRSTRYVLKIVALELSEHPQFGPGVRWVFNVLDMDDGDPAIVRQEDGEPYRYFQTTGTRIQAPKPGATKIPKAYKFACGFLGRAIQIGESGSDIARELIGKKAEAFIGPNDSGNMAIMSIDPIGTHFKQFRPAKPTAAAAAAPDEQPDTLGEAVAASRARSSKGTPVGAAAGGVDPEF